MIEFLASLEVIYFRSKKSPDSKSAAIALRPNFNRSVKLKFLREVTHAKQVVHHMG